MNQQHLITSPNRTVITAFTANQTNSFDNGHYVLHLASNKDSSATANNHLLSCALTDRTIHTYSQETLQKVHSIEEACTQPITDLSHASLTTGTAAATAPLLAASSQDGSIKLFDLRTQGRSPVLQMLLPKNEQALSTSLGYGGVLAAVGGSKGHIHFYDLRNISTNMSSANGANNQITNPLGSYVDAHTDEVTKVRFQPNIQVNTISSSSTTALLVSASEDGLVSVHDTSQPSEEAALKSVLNIQTPLRDVGFFGPSMEGLYCLTGSETMSVWHHESAQRIADFGVNIRDVLSSKMGGSISQPITYLVGCFWDGLSLNLLAGNGTGDSGIFTVDASGSLTLKRALSGGHMGCIRGFVSSSSGQTIVTGGEDARLCEWNLNGKLGMKHTGARSGKMQASAGSVSPNPGGGAIKRTKKKHLHNPY